METAESGLYFCLDPNYQTFPGFETATRCYSKLTVIRQTERRPRLGCDTFFSTYLPWLSGEPYVLELESFMSDGDSKQCALIGMAM